MGFVKDAVFGKAPSTQYVSPDKKIMPEPGWEAQDREKLNGAYWGDKGRFDTALGKQDENYKLGTGLFGNYANLGANYGSKFGDLSQGKLSPEFQNNFESAIKNDLTRTIGSNVNDLVGRGVMNSSVGNSVFNNIGNQVAEQSAKNYQTNLGLAGSMLDKGYDAEYGGLRGQTGLLGMLNGMNDQDIATAVNWLNSERNRLYSVQGDTIVNPGSQGLLGAALGGWASGGFKKIGG